MTDEQIVESLKAGQIMNYGVHGRNTEVVEFMADLENQGLVALTDVSSSQETRYSAKWIGDKS